MNICSSSNAWSSDNGFLLHTHVDRDPRRRPLSKSVPRLWALGQVCAYRQLPRRGDLCAAVFRACLESLTCKRCGHLQSVHDDVEGCQIVWGCVPGSMRMEACDCEEFQPA